MLSSSPSARQIAHNLLLGLQFSLSSAAALAQTEQPEPARNVVEPAPITISPTISALADSTKRLVQVEHTGLQPGEAESVALIKDLVDAIGAFSREIEHEQPFTLERASFVRRVMEHTILLPIVLQIGARQAHGEGKEPASEVAESLNQSILGAYGIVLSKLHQVHVKEPIDVTSLQEEYLRHYQHIYGMLSHASSAGREQIVDMLIAHLGQRDIVPTHQIVSDLARYPDRERDLLAYSVPQFFDQIGQSFREQLTDRDRLRSLSEGEIECLLNLHSVMKRGVAEAEQSRRLTAVQAESYRESIDQLYVRDLLPQISIFVRAMRFQTRGRPGDPFGLSEYPGAMAVESSAIRGHPITKGIERLLAAWPDDRSTLGALYFDQLDRVRETHGAGNLVGCMSIVMLPLVAPAPERKREIIDALREGLVDDTSKPYIGSTMNRPTQIARVLGVCLISDHAYFASEVNTSYNSQMSPMLIRALKDESGPLERYAEVLTPAQLFFVELLRIAAGGEGRESISWLTRYDSFTQDAVVLRARAALAGLMSDLYSCQPATIFQEGFLARMAPLATPTAWDTALMYPPGKGREEEWRSSAKMLFEYADIVSEQRLQTSPRNCSVYTVAMQLTEAAKRFRQRGSLVDRRNRDALCPAAQTLSELYREPRAVLKDAQVPTFFETLEQSIYQVASDTARRNDEKTNEERSISSEKLAAIAHRYVEVVQRACLAEFAFGEIIGVNRESLAALRIARRDLVTYCEALGFLERDQHLQAILTGDVDGLAEELAKYREALGQELAEVARQLGVEE